MQIMSTGISNPLRLLYIDKFNLSEINPLMNDFQTVRLHQNPTIYDKLCKPLRRLRHTEKRKISFEQMNCA